MKRLLLAAACGLLAIMTLAGPVGAREFGAAYVDDAIYRVFGNAAHVPDGTGTDPFATFTNSTNSDQLGVAQFAPGSATGHHGGRWAVYRATLDGVRRLIHLGYQLGRAPGVRRERRAFARAGCRCRLPLSRSGQS